MIIIYVAYATSEVDDDVNGDKYGLSNGVNFFDVKWCQWCQKTIGVRKLCQKAIIFDTIDTI